MTKIHKKCPECGGRGTVTYERAYSRSVGRDVGFIEEYEDVCENCSGDGVIEWDEEDYAEYEEERADWLRDKHWDEEMNRG